MISIYNKLFVLNTKSTTYAFQVLPTGHIEHLYYGSSIKIESEKDAEILVEKREFDPGNSVIYDNNNPKYCLDDIRLEASGLGKGDYRQPLVDIVFNDGSRTTDFVFDNYKLLDYKYSISNLPCSYGSEAKSLIINLVDKSRNLQLSLIYSVFYECDVITKSTKLTNLSKEFITLKSLMSNQLDFYNDDYSITNFTGRWISEMNKNTNKLISGNYSLNSTYGCTSSRANTFVILHESCATQNSGCVLGLNLIYGGNHYENVYVSPYNKIRFTQGINPDTFAWTLDTDEYFESPEAVMCLSSSGFNGMSQKMSNFVNNNIIRGYWKSRQRPVLINTWEASYFNITEQSIVNLALAAKKCDIELVVMDDGWFGRRDNDKSSLGDWDVNKEKLPNGLSGLANKIGDIGLDFGIWVEPEMVSKNSKLYKKHPSWALEIPSQNHSEGRWQRVLDLSNPEVVDYLIEKLSNVFSSANISYVKWDMNRNWSDYFSQYLNSNKMRELNHRYYIGLYRLMKTLVDRFPKILFEGCSSGGNRFDLATLCYFPQIWASDNTDTLSRVNIQDSYSYGYPLSTISAHVSDSPNHQTMRDMPLNSRFNVAIFGLLGYELDLTQLSEDEISDIKKQVQFYKKFRKTLQFGNLYRCENNNIIQWTCVSNDQTQAIALIFQKLEIANNQHQILKVSGLDANKKYKISTYDQDEVIKDCGKNIVAFLNKDEDINTLDISSAMKYYKRHALHEEYISYGSAIMQGINISCAFGGTGFNDNVRIWRDFASRIYIIEEV